MPGNDTKPSKEKPNLKRLHVIQIQNHEEPGRRSRRFLGGGSWIERLWEKPGGQESYKVMQRRLILALELVA